MFLQFLLDHHHHVPCSYLVFPISMDVCGCQWKLVRRKVCPCSDRIARSWTELIDLFLMRLWEEQSWPWFRRIFHFHQMNFLEGFSGKYFLNLFRIYMGGTKWCHLSSNCSLIQVLTQGEFDHLLLTWNVIKSLKYTYRTLHSFLQPKIIKISHWTGMIIIRAIKVTLII